MTLDLEALAEAFLHWLHQREIRQDDPVTVKRFGEAYQHLAKLAQEADCATQNHLVKLLMQGLTPAQSSWEFGCVANTCGMIVEQGGDPALALEPILDRLTEQLARVPEFVRTMQEHLGVEQPNQVAEQVWPKLGAEHPEQAWVIGEWFALRFMGCAAMTMLCRDVGQRQRARQRIDLLQRAEATSSDNPFAYYLAELLGMVDDEPMLVLDVQRRLGFRVRLTAIRNNFHLFTLLQDALLAHPSAKNWPGPHVRPLVVSVAKSERMLPDISPNEWNADGPQPGDEAFDSALWTYYTWFALKPDGTLRTMAESKGMLPSWVWGEAKPTEIPSLEGERILLLGPLECPRTWSLGFFVPLHPALRSSVVIEQELSAEEYHARIEKICGGR